MLFCISRDLAGHSSIIPSSTQTYGKWQVTVIYFQVFLQLGNFGISYHFYLICKSFITQAFLPWQERELPGGGKKPSQTFPTAQEKSEGTLLLPLMGKGPNPREHTHICGHLETLQKNDNLKNMYTDKYLYYKNICMCTYTHTEYVYTYKVINPGYNKGNN